MKLFIKIVGIALLLIVVLLAGGFFYIKSALPDVGPPPDVKAPVSMEAIQRGEYLANHVTVCMDCHSERNWNKFAGPLVEGTLGKGGDVFPEEAGFPGTFYPPNLTPYNLASHTDGEIYRAITTGVKKNGEPIFPLMPYPTYGNMTKDDVLAIIAYIRTLEPIENKVAESTPSFPFSLIMRTIPQPATPTESGNFKNSLELGKYLTKIAACADCHTPNEKGEPLPGMDFAGGMEFSLPTGGTVRTSNITPHPSTGIGSWTREEFINRFKFYEHNDSLFTQRGEFNTLMPWKMYAGMKEEDLGAIYDFLKTQKPVENLVVRFTQ